MKITFVIGGARSGKSSFALREASKITGPKAFIATAEALDDEMKDRIDKHRIERGGDWSSYEEPIRITGILSEVKDRYPVIVLDCLTIWLSNLMIRTQNSERRQQSTDNRAQTTEEIIQKFIDTLLKHKHSSVCSLGSGFCALYIVSNEVGLGIVPENKLSRQFRDLAGALNQKVAEIADEVYLVAAGIPMKIKG